MKNSASILQKQHPDPHHDNYARTLFGFWLYLMTDFILFGALFATYVVLSFTAYGGNSPSHELFNLPFALIQTLLMLLSSLTIGLAGASAHRKLKERTIALFGITFLLGAVFMSMQFTEFSRLIHTGNSWEKSGFLSGYFTVVGTFGLHVLFGLLWMIVLIVPIWREGINVVGIRRLTCLRMFWQFLNIVWVFIFSFVYLMM